MDIKSNLFYYFNHLFPIINKTIVIQLRLQHLLYSLIINFTLILNNSLLDYFKIVKLEIIYFY